MTKRSSTGDGMLMAVRSLLSRFRRDEVGAALVEMTIITPFMLTLAAGVFEFSNIIHTKLLIEAGIEDAARYIARCVRAPADKEDCEDFAQNLAVTATIDGTGALRVTSCSPAWSPAAVVVTSPYPFEYAINQSTGVRDYLSLSDRVETVEVTTTCQYVGTGLFSFLGFSPLSLTASHQERVLGW